MNKNNKILLVVIAIVIIAAAAIGISMFMQDDTGYPFNTKFMEGSFAAEAKEVPINTSNYTDFAASYKDSKNNIEYNITCCKNASAYIDYLALMSNLTNPEERSYNGINWTIYYTQGLPSNLSFDNASQKDYINVYICYGHSNKEDFIIYITSPSQNGGDVYSDFFKTYGMPFLESIHTKDVSNVPECYDVLGLSQSDYSELSKEIADYKANQTIS